MDRLRNFVFTINNYTDDDIKLLSTVQYRYLVYGFEVGKEGVPHIQGYCELSKQTRFNTVKALFPRAHIEHRMGTAKQAAEYCKKDGNFKEFGALFQGHRTDLDCARQDALDGGMRLVTSKYSYNQIKVVEKYLTYNEQVRDFKPEVTWLYGPSGCGKSRKARELVDPEDTYVKSSSDKWWDGYDGHSCVIMDDFRGSWMTFSDFLTLIDRYERRVEFKGGTRQMLAKKIVITSIYSPQQCYRMLGDEPIKQLLRRIDNLINLENKSLNINGLQEEIQEENLQEEVL